MATTMPKAKAKSKKQNTRDKLILMEKELTQEIIGRDSMIHSIILSIIARQHMMVIGPPGNAKTMMYDRTFRRIKGANVFSTLITPYTSADEILGPPSIRTLKEHDRIERNTEGMMPEAHYYIGDEFWNMPETLAGSQLRALNERQVFDGTKFIDIPLRTLVAASNKLPYGEGFLAILDRIAVRHYLPAPSHTEGDLMTKILLSSVGEPQTTVTLEEIDAATEESRSIPLSDEFIDFLVNELRPALVKLDVGLVESSISPRRWKQGITLAQADAWLSGAKTVEKANARVFRDVCWNKETQIKDVHNLIDNLIGKERTVDGNTLYEELNEIIRQHDQDMARAENLAANGNVEAAADSVTNKTKQWGDKLNEIQRDWATRYRNSDEYDERMKEIKNTNLMLAGRSKEAYDTVGGGL